MTSREVEIVIQRAWENFPNTHPRIISDNGPQFTAKDFKEYIRYCGMKHVRTSPYYPQSNGKVERYHQTTKCETIRKKAPDSIEEAKKILEEYIHEYNNYRLHSAIGYVAPIDKLEGRADEIIKSREDKLEKARENRKKVNNIKLAA